ncbi:hypothetical protein ACROYT_G014133 [Oculina patagonica]
MWYGLKRCDVLAEEDGLLRVRSEDMNSAMLVKERLSLELKRMLISLRIADDVRSGDELSVDLVMQEVLSL